MVIQCAWCLRILGEKEPKSDMSVTHSICQKCADNMVREVYGKAKKEG